MHAWSWWRRRIRQGRTPRRRVLTRAPWRNLQQAAVAFRLRYSLHANALYRLRRARPRVLSLNGGGPQQWWVCPGILPDEVQYA
jgi:hypothetical protein